MPCLGKVLCMKGFPWYIELLGKVSIAPFERIFIRMATIKRECSDISDNNKRLCVEENKNIRRKRKVAVLMGYSGQGYLGMQRNPGTKTVEEDLFTALLKAGLISEEGFSQIQTIQFQRAARTDKGVSAARQLVSLKLPDGTTLDEVNKHLPDKIQVFSIRRVTKGFNSKTNCDARTYAYTLPTFAFAPENETNEQYHISTSVVSYISEILKTFVGTHNFHNFTSKKKYQDPSAIRYIMDFACSEPFMMNNLEFVTLKVKGQSFMLHQIRKMVGITIAIARGLADIATIQKAWGSDRIDIPVAPGLGLVLEELHYDRYNNKFGKDGLHEALEWNEVKSLVENFKEKYIYPTIVETELNEKSMLNWLETLPLHTFDVREDEVPLIVSNENSQASDSSSKEHLSIGSESLSSQICANLDEKTFSANGTEDIKQHSVDCDQGVSQITVKS